MPRLSRPSTQAPRQNVREVTCGDLESWSDRSQLVTISTPKPSKTVQRDSTWQDVLSHTPSYMAASLDVIAAGTDTNSNDFDEESRWDIEHILTRLRRSIYLAKQQELGNLTRTQRDLYPAIDRDFHLLSITLNGHPRLTELSQLARLTAEVVDLVK